MIDLNSGDEERGRKRIAGSIVAYSWEKRLPEISGSLFSI